MQYDDRIAEILKKPRMMGQSLDYPGQNAEPLLRMIKEFVKPDFKVVEIGSYSGGSSELFAMFCEKLYCVDCWKDNDNPMQDGITLEDAHNKLSAAELKFDEMALNYKNISKIRMLSSVACDHFQNGSIDMVYIDGNHKFDNVINDIKSWYPKVKIGGVVSGHDYYENIKIAVNHVLGEPLKVYEDTSWVFIKNKEL